jgi:hypothetical protein
MKPAGVSESTIARPISAFYRTFRQRLLHRVLLLPYSPFCYCILWGVLSIYCFTVYWGGWKPTLWDYNII